MRSTRSSTRTSTTAPRYTEDSASSANEDTKASNGTKNARKKRTRDAEDEEKPATASKQKKTPSSNTKAASKPKATPSSADAPAPKKTAPPAPTSSSNRDASGEQEVYWLLKAEPLPRFENGVNVAFSIDDLKACTEPEPWGGVRNPQARNNMQAMRKGDIGFFYHSNAKPSGVVGILRVVNEAHPDETAFDSKDPYYDAKSKKDEPKWFCVDVEFVEKFDEVVDLKTLKGHAEKGGKLEGMQLVTNSRLSVSRVRKEEWDFIVGLAREEK